MTWASAGMTWLSAGMTSVSIALDSGFHRNDVGLQRHPRQGSVRIEAVAGAGILNTCAVLRISTARMLFQA